jgi:DNA-binding XRE family transcriptional regulator
MGVVQIIKTPGGEEMVVIPKADYDELLRRADEAAEDAADAAIYDARKAEFQSQEPFPAEVSMAILRGDSRLRALRKWRGLTQSDIAEKAGLTQGFLSDLEARRRTASSDTVGRLASALDVPSSWIED